MIAGSNVLREARIRRESFDPTNGEHLASARKWLETGNWGSVQFFAEGPYVSVTETVLRRLANSALVSAGY
jgi:hypothetical protein